jgi:hypothetical protein
MIMLHMEVVVGVRPGKTRPSVGGFVIFEILYRAIEPVYRGEGRMMGVVTTNEKNTRGCFFSL